MTWALSSERHDLVIHRGRLAVVLGADEVRQRVLIALLHHWREYFLNVPGGVPWYDLLLGSKDRRLVELVVRRAVLDVPGVIGVAAIDVSFSTTLPRHLDLRMALEVAEIRRSPAVRIIGGGVTVTVAGEQVSFVPYDWADSTPLPL